MHWTSKRARAPASQTGVQNQRATCSEDYALKDPPATDQSREEATPRVDLADVVITRELARRSVRGKGTRREETGMRALADAFSLGAPAVLDRLAALAVELCFAGTGGVSVIEPGSDGEEIFRWRALAGALERFKGGTTPRHWSPCGHCLRNRKPTLYSHPARYFTYFQQLDLPIVEGLVIPIYWKGAALGTIWIVSHDEQRRFDAEDARVMTSLAHFAAHALVPAPQPVFKTNAGNEQTHVWETQAWEQAVRRIARGDQDALAMLSQEASPLIFAAALRVLSYRADAEEVTADTLMRIWRTAGSYDPARGSVYSWLMRMTRTMAIDRLRSRAVRDRSEMALTIECGSILRHAGDSADLEAGRYLRQALQTLPFEQRRAIEMAYFDGMTALEIAERLGHPLGSVKSRIRLGIMKLRVLMAATS
jgi:RNA polymerase sigma factor (sigma-70 family)